MANLIPHSCYFICSIARSGSWLLAEGLESLGIAGRPREYFEMDLEQFWTDRLGIVSDFDYLFKILMAGTTPNGWFGSKQQWGGFCRLCIKLLDNDKYSNVDACNLISKLFMNLHYIWLVRHNKDRQAISYYRAVETNMWWERIDDARDSIRSEEGLDIINKKVEYDFDKIEELEKLLISHETAWLQYFGQCKINPFTIVYEEFVDAYESTIIKTLDYLQIPYPSDLQIKRPMLKQQADALTEEWLENYTKTKRARNKGYKG